MQNRKGSTLIELLIVVVIIGILAAIAIPKFANTKEKAYVAAMKSDLKNLSTAQEGFFADSLAYFDQADITQAAPYEFGGQVIFAPSAGVTIDATAVAPDAAAGTQAGWYAVAQHDATKQTCAIFLNIPAADIPAPAENEG